MLDRLERAFERAIEGSIAGVFRLRVQPAEIGRRLERALLDRRVTSMGATLAPNRFDVRLHPEDARDFADWDDALCRELEDWLVELAFARGIATVGPFRVRLLEDDAVPRRSVRATGHFAADREESLGGSALVALRLVPARPSDPAATLRQLLVRVGRLPDNDLVISNPDVSRHHARLEARGRDWRIVDLGSTNGTWVNGARVVTAEIEPGDQLAFGSVRFAVQFE